MRSIAAAILAGIVAACATQHPAYLKGQELAAMGQWERAIEQMELAAKEDARNYQYRAAIIDVRLQAQNEILRQAGALREAGQYTEAESAYRRVLRLQPDEGRALAGLAQIGVERRRDAVLQQAEAMLGKGNIELVEQTVRKVLTEAPRNARALALMRRIEDARPRPSTAANQLPAALKRPITLQFRDADLRVILDVISRESGLNFILDRDIRQDLKASIFVRNSPINEAIDSMLAANGLAKKITGDTNVLVYPNTPQKARDYQDLVIRNFFLQSADAKQIQTMLRTILRSRDTYIDEKRNLVVMRDTPEMVRLAERLISTHDQGEPEVMLEVEVLEVGRGLTSNLGARFPDSISLGVADPTTLRNLNNLDASGVNISGLGSIVALNLRKLYSNVNLLANPRIRVRNKEKAKIHVGDRIPVISSSLSTTAAISTQTVNYLDIGLKLEVEPQVLDEHIMIKVGLEVSSLGAEVKNQNSIAYQIGTRNANTTLTLKDGETQILAGLINDNERETTNRLPGIGELPVVGRLFSNVSKSAEKTEIVLSITPRLIRRLERPSADMAEFWSGPESNLSTLSGAPASPPPPPGAVPVGPRPGVAGVAPIIQPGQVPQPVPTTPPQGAPQAAPAPAAPAAQPQNPQGAPPQFFFQPPPGVGG